MDLLKWMFVKTMTFCYYPISFVKAICTDFKVRDRFMSSFMVLFTITDEDNFKIKFNKDQS